MFRKISSFVCASALGATLLSTAASADDPNDPAMKNAAARARDSAETRRLNQAQLAYVSERDARTAQAKRETQGANDKAYADARADYERKMAAWRRAVAACNAGQREYCGH